MTAEYLGTLVVDAIYCSTLGRALETAAIISEKFPNTERVRAACCANRQTWAIRISRKANGAANKRSPDLFDLLARSKEAK
jgi:hypothetical protein